MVIFQVVQFSSYNLILPEYFKIIYIVIIICFCKNKKSFGTNDFDPHTPSVSATDLSFSGKECSHDHFLQREDTNEALIAEIDKLSQCASPSTHSSI